MRLPKRERLLISTDNKSSPSNVKEMSISLSKFNNSFLTVKEIWPSSKTKLSITLFNNNSYYFLYYLH